MMIITISREFGSGGRELGKRLADQLGFDYYDREIIASIAGRSGMDESYVENALENQVWKNVPISFGRSFGIGSIGMVSTTLLLEQTRVLEEIAKMGRNCVIVGRNADIILSKYKPFNIFVCAETNSKIQRCISRMKPEENLSSKEIERNMRRIDKGRALSRQIITGSRWGDPHNYHLTINTTDQNIKELTKSVAEYALASL